MKRRCKGGRFSYDPAWEEFRGFLRDIGPRPTPEHSLDRIDTHLPVYGPNLCRWADKLEQTQNRTNTRYVEVGGQTMTLQEFADQAGAPYKTVHSAISRGESPETILARFTNRGAGYCPIRYQNRPDAYENWLKRYRDWRSKIQRDRQHLASLEVYDILVVSQAFLDAAERLSRMGFDELTEDEDGRADAMLRSDEGQIWTNAPAWLDGAITALSTRDPKVAKRVLAHGPDWRDLKNFRVWLEKPASQRAH